MEIHQNETLAMESLKEPEQFQRIMVPTLIYLTLMMITGIIGNSVVCIINYYKFQRCSVWYYILAMAMVNLLTCVVVMPIEFVFLLRYDLDVSELECKVVMFVKAGVVGFSGNLLVVVAIARYKKVCKTTEFNPKKGAVVCVFLTVLSTAPTTFFTGRNTIYFEGTNVTGLTCFVADDLVDSVFLKQYAWSWVGYLCIGAIVISVAYFRIARHLLKHKKHMEMYLMHKDKPGSTNTSNTMTRAVHINECPTEATTDKSLSSEVNPTFSSSPRGPPRTTALSSDISPSPASQGTRGQMPLSRGLASTTQIHGGPSQIQPTLEPVIGDYEANILCGTSRKGDVEDVRVPEIEATCMTTSAGKGGKAGKTATEPADGKQDTELKTLSRCQSPEGQSSQSHSVDGFEFIIEPSSMDKLAHTKAGQKQTEIADKHSGKVTESAKEMTSELSDKSNDTIESGESSAVDSKSLMKKCWSLTKKESRIAEPCLTTSDSLQVSTPMSRPTPELQVQRDLTGHLRPDQVKPPSRSVFRIPSYTSLMMYILTAVFVLNFLPYLWVLIIYGGRDVRYNMFQICIKSYCINCSVNPVIYGFCSSKFRMECFKLFTFRFKFEDSKYRSC